MARIGEAAPAPVRDQRDPKRIESGFKLAQGFIQGRISDIFDGKNEKDISIEEAHAQDGYTEQVPDYFVADVIWSNEDVFKDSPRDEQAGEYLAGIVKRLLDERRELKKENAPWVSARLNIITQNLNDLGSIPGLKDYYEYTMGVNYMMAKISKQARWFAQRNESILSEIEELKLVKESVGEDAASPLENQIEALRTEYAENQQAIDEWHKSEDYKKRKERGLED